MLDTPGKNVRRDPANPTRDTGWDWRDPKWDLDRDYGMPRVRSQGGIPGGIPPEASYNPGRDPTMDSTWILLAKILTSHMGSH